MATSTKTKMSITIEVELKEILGKIDQKLDGIQKDITELNIGQAELRGGQSELRSNFSALESSQKTMAADIVTLKQDVTDLKGAKSLIIPIIVAVTTSVLTLLIRSIPLA